MHKGQQAPLLRNLLEVFNERDEAARLPVIEQLYTEAAIFYESESSFSGFQQINQRVTEVLATLPPRSRFQPTGDQSRNHNLARLPWTLVLENGSTVAAGMDVAVMEDDRIAALYLFIDPPVASS